MRKTLDRALVASMIADPHVSKKDLQLAMYLCGHDAQITEIADQLFGGTSRGAKANARRSLHHLLPYLEINSIDVTSGGRWYRLKNHYDPQEQTGSDDIPGQLSFEDLKASQV